MFYFVSFKSCVINVIIDNGDKEYNINNTTKTDAARNDTVPLSYAPALFSLSKCFLCFTVDIINSIADITVAIV